MARVFISYATLDRAIADAVLGWLLDAGHEPFLAHSLRDGIGVGERWKQRLYDELREVDAVLGVVTSSFVESNWCSAEVGIADALGCRLIPLRAEAGVVHPLMPDLHYAEYHADVQLGMAGGAVAGSRQRSTARAGSDAGEHRSPSGAELVGQRCAWSARRWP
ncbi:MAG: toll/interleukin-1 receptor domain-containing protein [Pseudonocardiaceae bacterium]